MTAPKYENIATTCTTLVERKEYVQLPGQSKGYLAEKAQYALKFPKVLNVKRKDGSSYQSLLLQLVMSAQIRVDESLADYYWDYKAEVSFDMTPTRKLGGVPKPFLSSSNRSEGPGRRHAMNPFPHGRVKDYLRRPDVIIVKNKSVRWPGLATTDHEGFAHPDNLLRLVEMKFPGDVLDPNQERAYKLIAGGGVDRMCVVDVYDCQGDLEKARHRAAIRTEQPIAAPVYFERWLTEVEKEIKPLWDTVGQGVRHLGNEAQAWLRAQAPWLFTSGRWVREASGQAYQWITDQGQLAARWTHQQLQDAWHGISQATDLVWEQVKSIEWSQVLIDVVRGVCAIGLCIAGVVIAVTLAPALLAALLAIIGISSMATA